MFKQLKEFFAYEAKFIFSFCNFDVESRRKNFKITNIERTM